MAPVSPCDSSLLENTKDLKQYAYIMIYPLAHLTTDKLCKKKKTRSHRLKNKINISVELLKHKVIRAEDRRYRLRSPKAGGAANGSVSQRKASQSSWAAVTKYQVGGLHMYLPTPVKTGSPRSSLAGVSVW